MKMVTCKKCGKKGLAWKETLSGYKLCENIGIHMCDLQIKDKKVRKNKIR